MTTHNILTDTYYRTFAHTNPVLAHIEAGDTVVTKCVDAGGRDLMGVQRSEPGNPLTGPFYIEGAEPGDALLVRLDRVRCNRDWGWSSYRLGLYALLPDAIETTYSSHYKADLVREGRDNIVPWDIDLQAGTTSLREPSPSVATLDFPVAPMVGCIGVAAPGDAAPTSGPSGAYGGNIDYNRIAEGATVWLPVHHPGALLYVGDGHALQGDGEPLGTAVETSMDIDFTVHLRKGGRTGRPTRRKRRDDLRDRQPARIRQLHESRPANGHHRHGELALRRLRHAAVGSASPDRHAGPLRRRHRRRLHGSPPTKGVPPLVALEPHTTSRPHVARQLTRMLLTSLSIR